jgi:flagellum-specific ATP synthase
VLQSLSRLQPHLVKPDVKAAADLLRRNLSEYQKNADLISIGAYRPGSNLALDRAIALREPARALLTQRSDEMVPMAQTHTTLLSLTGTV